MDKQPADLAGDNAVIRADTMAQNCQKQSYTSKTRLINFRYNRRRS